MEKSLSIGKIAVHFPDHSSKEFCIFDDLASLFNLETNYDAEKFLKKKIRENGITKNIDFDSESDFVSLRTRNASLILEVAILINELANISIDKESKEVFKKILFAFKPSKKQIWEIGDIFSIPLSDQTYYFGQIIGKIGGLWPICIILNKNKNVLPDKEELTSADIVGALSFIPDRLDNFTFKVVNNLPVLRQVDEKVKRNPILYSQYTSNCIIDFCEEFKNRGTSSKYWGFIDNKNYLK
jgi:hypothetical protein